MGGISEDGEVLQTEARFFLFEINTTSRCHLHVTLHLKLSPVISVLLLAEMMKIV